MIRKRDFGVGADAIRSLLRSDHQRHRRAGVRKRVRYYCIEPIFVN
jgi:hypothetical protein